MMSVTDASLASVGQFIDAEVSLLWHKLTVAFLVGVRYCPDGSSLVGCWRPRIVDKYLQAVCARVDGPSGIRFH
jgi:hypothetical protein